MQIRNQDITANARVDVANFLLIDKRMGKASTHHQHIVAPKDLSSTMLTVQFYEYLYCFTVIPVKFSLNLADISQRENSILALV